MPINLLADDMSQPINLFAEQQPHRSFHDLSPEDQEGALNLARQEISQKYPNLPDWLRDAILHITPKDHSPMLEHAAKGFSNVTDYIPAIAGGALQGASLPIRGAASLLPGEFSKKLANSPNLTSLFPSPQTGGQQAAQMGGEFAGSLGPLGKLFGALKGGAQLAKVPKALQNASALAGTGFIGTPGDTTEKGLGAASALALGGAGKVASKAGKIVGGNLPTFMRGLSSESTPEALISAVQKPHDKLQSTADELYGQVRTAINKRGIKPKINHKYLDEIMEYPSMQSKTHKELIQKAKDGDYEAQHKLQSSLYKKGTKDILNDDSVIETRGENLLELRDKINEDLEHDLLKEGHIDVAHVLKQGKKAVSQLKSTYFDKLLPKGIGKMVHNDTRLIPENPEKLFSENSVPMGTFLDKHPEVAKHAQGIKEKEAAIKALKKIFMGAGLTGASLTGAKMISDLFK